MAAAIVQPPPALLAPFAILLITIAIFPLVLKQHWERHYQKLCALLAATTCGYYFFALHGAARVQHAAGEYVSSLSLSAHSLSWPGPSICTFRDPPHRWQMSRSCSAEACWQILSAPSAHRCSCSAPFCT